MLLLDHYIMQHFHGAIFMEMMLSWAIFTRDATALTVPWNDPPAVGLFVRPRRHTVLSDASRELAKDFELRLNWAQWEIRIPQGLESSVGTATAAVVIVQVGVPAAPRRVPLCANARTRTCATK